MSGARGVALAAALGAAAAAWAAAPGAGGMVSVPGGTFRMGTDRGHPYEGPEHEVAVRPFRIDSREVTVAGFRAFVRATGYKTESERFGWSAVFDVAGGRWTKVDGADWRRPEGPGAAPAAPQEPVTQVSWNDATAYCRWAGKRLPTEAEWEFAARGGLAGRTYAWGDEPRPGGRWRGNWWQGTFPQRNTGEDGFLRRAPVGRFPPNGYGLYDMAGNVWEWCQDWFSERGYVEERPLDPRGPATGRERVIRGGSWMCAANYCTGYRVAARSHATPDSALNNLGFRCAK